MKLTRLKEFCSSSLKLVGNDFIEILQRQKVMKVKLKDLQKDSFVDFKLILTKSEQQNFPLKEESYFILIHFVYLLLLFKRSGFIFIIQLL